MIKPGKKVIGFAFGCIIYLVYDTRKRVFPIISFARPGASVHFAQSVTFFRKRCKKTTTAVQPATAAAACSIYSTCLYRRYSTTGVCSGRALPPPKSELAAVYLAGFMRQLSICLCKRRYSGARRFFLSLFFWASAVCEGLISDACKKMCCPYNYVAIILFATFFLFVTFTFPA